ncbi:hypothetical protein [Streptosporangium longisporum]|uniref:Serine hydrolase n=1 Tax=Streptosporangium longisporum TaxID=46187 RepID=A0ABP6K9P7_9ACTN
MKRYIAGLACAATAVLGVPALASTAHAQVADPVTALKSQFKNGRGVTYTDTIKIRRQQKTEVLGKRVGELQFGTSGVIASDHTTTLRIKEGDLGLGLESNDEEGSAESKRFNKLMAGLAEPERVVRIGNKAYISGGAFSRFMPTDRSWLQYPEDTHGVTGSMGQPVNAAEPATLKALLAHATVKQTSAYAGKITYSELHKVSPWFRAGVGQKLLEPLAKMKINWKLFLDGRGLPARLTISSGGSTITTAYTNWGAPVAITAPPADQIATVKDVQAGFEAVETIPLLSGK